MKHNRTKYLKGSERMDWEMEERRMLENRDYTGRLRTEGRAVKECKYDLMEITLTFEAKERTTAAALKAITERCESFLAQMKAEGIFGDYVSYERDDINKNVKIVGAEVTASRKIQIRYEFDVKLINHLLEMIRKSKAEVELNTRCWLSKDEEIQNELIKKAVLSARKRAELIAEAAGQKIVGVANIEIRNNDYDLFEGENDCYYDEDEQATPKRKPLFGRGVVPIDGSSTPITDLLKGPSTKMSVTATVLWKIS